MTDTDTKRREAEQRVIELARKAMRPEFNSNAWGELAAALKALDAPADRGAVVAEQFVISGSPENRIEFKHDGFGISLAYAGYRDRTVELIRNAVTRVISTFAADAARSAGEAAAEAEREACAKLAHSVDFGPRDSSLRTVIANAIRARKDVTP